MQTKLSIKADELHPVNLKPAELQKGSKYYINRLVQFRLPQNLLKMTPNICLGLS